MSLINDALKRASQAQKETPPSPARPPSSPEPLLRPVESRLPPSSVTPLLLGAILLICLLGAGVAGWAWLHSHPATASAPAPQTAVVSASVASSAAPVPTPGTKPTPVPVATAVPPVKVAVPTPVQPSPAAPPAAVAAAIPTPTIVNTPEPAPAPVTTPAAPAFPAVKLQGIFYSPTKPICVLNGKNCSVGTKVNGVEVIKIEPEAVTVRFGAETKVLEISP